MQRGRRRGQRGSRLQAATGLHAPTDTKRTLHDLVELAGSRAYLPMVPAQLLDGRRAGKEVDEVGFSEERRRRTTGFRGFPQNKQTSNAYCWYVRVQSACACSLIVISGPSKPLCLAGPVPATQVVIAGADPHCQEQSSRRSSLSPGMHGSAAAHHGFSCHGGH